MVLCSINVAGYHIWRMKVYLLSSITACVCPERSPHLVYCV